MKNISGVAGVLMLSLLAACSSDRPDAQTGIEEADTLRAYVLSVDRTPIFEAFDRLESRAHRIERRDVVHRDGGHEPFAASMILAAEGREYALESTDTTGTLPSCRSCRWLGRETSATLDVLPRLVLESEPPFLDERGVHAFAFHAEEDTVVAGHPVHVIRGSAYEDEPRAGMYRSVRLFVEPVTRSLLGIEAEIDRQTFFLSERGTRVVFLQADAAGYFPSRLGVRQDIRVFIGERRILETEISYRLGSEPPSATRIR